MEAPEVTVTVTEDDEVIDIDLNDPEVEAAATKIQAGFKGHKARKQVKELQGEKKEGEVEVKVKEEIETEDKKEQEINNEEKKEDIEEQKGEEIDIDLTDPEVEAAATKIQAGFKGHKARKEVSQMKTEQDGTDQPDGGAGVEEDAID